MKITIVLVVALGFASATPIEEQTSIKKLPCPQLPDINEADISNNTPTTESTIFTTDITDKTTSPLNLNDNTTPAYSDGEVDIIIEDNEPTLEDIPQDNVEDQFSVTNLFRNTLQRRLENQIMAAAKGFAPIPIFKRRQHHKHRYPIRRQFNGYPYRKFHFVYPYYRFYRPSSLRFY